MIQSTKGKLIKQVMSGKPSKGFPANVFSVAVRKVNMVNSAVELSDLRSPPGNQLEALHGNRTGQHSIRINGQWRICFVWSNAGPQSVEITDYH